MYFAWNKEYSVDNEEIDNQHKKFFEIGEKVSNIIFANEASYRKEDVMSILYELKDYTRFHFSFEETLMKKYGYAHYETHKNEHNLFVEKIKKIEGSDTENLPEETIIELINFIFEWISGHILKSDKKYSVFFRSIMKLQNI